MAYQEIYQDESTQKRLKSLYICITPGCRIVMETKRKFCPDHMTAEDRVETMKEFRERIPAVN
jgi:hypothetical protein